MFDVLEGDGGAGSGGDDSDASSVIETAVACLAAGVERADPFRATREAVSVDGDALVVQGERYSLADVDRVVVVGAGKGCDRVASALVDALGGRVDDGLVVVDEPAAGLALGPVSVRVGDHPVPSERGVAATRDVRELVADADEGTLVLVALTGGASALLAAPVESVGLDALRAVTSALLGAGAAIGEVNAVRKHVSTVKGGRLAVAATPARVLTVAVSDVVGDDPAIVGSGPTAPDASTFADALAVLDRYDIDAPAVRSHLEAGAAGGGWGGVAETPGADHDAFEDVPYHVVASARTAVDGAKEAAASRGFEATVLSTTMQGEANECGRFHAAVGREVASAGDPVEPPAVLVSAGETTVTVSGDGDGGPNQEFVLGAALDLADGPRPPDGVDVAVAAVDTDGRDGSTDEAGAVLAGDALADAELRDGARDALARNDATGFFERFERAAAPAAPADADDRRFGGRLRSGATGTNVNDLRVVVVDDR
ncbi:glycerate kinase type-2 family protein [Halorubellus litoreus]|uniref:Glycerate kinase n=1 Tax=Halorubellus litoreus TaxID=755308 RepID=A0ABD5VFN2_9EURY